MATVLIIATDRMIGGLLGKLVDLTGNVAHLPNDDEQPADAVRRRAPTAVMLDAGYGSGTLEAVSAAAREIRAPVVYFATTLALGELRQFALSRRATYFPLPAGPNLLARVLAAAIGDGRPWRDADGSSAAQYTLMVASAAVSRARTLVDRAAAIRTEGQSLRSEHEAALAHCRQSYAGLREAVIAYTRELRGEGVPPDRALEMVKRALRDETSGAGPATQVDRAVDDAVEWCLQAYFAG